MKTAKEWLNAVGEAVMATAFVGGKPPGIETENVIKQIQLDAWKQGMTDAAVLVRNICDLRKEI